MVGFSSRFFTDSSSSDSSSNKPVDLTLFLTRFTVLGRNLSSSFDSELSDLLDEPLMVVAEEEDFPSSVGVTFLEELRDEDDDDDDDDEVFLDLLDVDDDDDDDE